MGTATLVTRPQVIDLTHGFTDLTTKEGKVTISFTVKDLPIYDVTISQDLGERYQLRPEEIEYSLGLNSGESDGLAPTTWPGDGSPVTGSLVWAWEQIPVGEHSLVFPIRDHGVGASDGSEFEATEWNEDGPIGEHAHAVDAAHTRVYNAAFQLEQAADTDKDAPDYDDQADAPGELVKYTITAKFLAEDPYRSISIKDSLPPGLEYVADTATTGHGITFVQQGKELEWSIADHAQAKDVVLEYQARIVHEDGGEDSLANTATAGFEIEYPGYPDSGSGSVVVGYSAAEFPRHLRATANIPFREPNATLARASSLTGEESIFNLVAGTPVTHTLTVTNAGNAPLYELKVKEQAPAGVLDAAPSDIEVYRQGANGSGDPVKLDENTDYTYSYSDGALLFAFEDTALGTLQPGEGFAVQFVVTVDAAIGADATLVHGAQILEYWSQPTGVDGRRPYPESAVETVTFKTVASDLSKGVTPENLQVAPGDTVFYEVDFTAPSMTTLHDVMLTETTDGSLLKYEQTKSIVVEPADARQWTVWEPVLDDGHALHVLNLFLPKDSAGDLIYSLANDSEHDHTYTLQYQYIVTNDEAVTRGEELASVLSYSFKPMATADLHKYEPKTTVLTVIEPALEAALTELSAGPYVAGDEVTYQISIGHAAGLSDAKAYDVLVAFEFPVGLTYESYQAGNPDGDTPDEPGQPHMAADAQQIAVFGQDGSIDLDLGEGFTFTITGTVDDTVQPDQVLTCNVKLTWSSTGGPNKGKAVEPPILHGVPQENPALTDGDGIYRFSVLPGTYIIQVAATGYHTITTSGFSASGEIQRDFQLTPKGSGDLVVEKVAQREFVDVGGENEFAIAITNNTEFALDRVEVVDTLPAGVTYVPDSGTEGVEHSQGILTWSLVGVEPGTTVLAYRVTVDGDANIGIVLTNEVTAQMSSYAGTSVGSASFTVAAWPQMDLEIRADRTGAEIGDRVRFAVELLNNSGGQTPMISTDTWLEVILPPGFIYQGGTTRLNGVEIGDPGIEGSVLRWDVGSVAPDEEVSLAFTATITIDAVDSAPIIEAYVDGTSEAGYPYRFGPAKTRLRLFKGVFGTSGTILGTAFIDYNANGIQDLGEPGVEGVELYFDHGHMIQTDAYGLYSIGKLVPGTRSMTVATWSLPDRDLFEAWQRGDACIERDLAPSGQRLYASLTHRDGSMLLGDFNTAWPGPARYTDYQRQVTGLRGEHKIGLTGFLYAQGKDVHTENMWATGLAGLYYLRETQVIVNSEQIWLQAMAPDADGELVEVSRRLLRRGIDYKLNYQLGSISFTSPIASLDRDLNEVWLEVTYATTGSDQQAYGYGLRW